MQPFSSWMAPMERMACRTSKRPMEAMVSGPKAAASWARSSPPAMNTRLPLRAASRPAM